MSVYRRKGTKFYTMDFQFKGVRIYESTEVSTLPMARTVERNRRRELEEGRAGITRQDGPTFFKPTAERWLEMKSATVEPSTHRIERTNLNHLYPAFGKRFVTEITPEEIAAYQKMRLAQGYAKKTVNLEVGTLRAVLIYCGQWARVQGSQKSSKVRFLKTRESHGQALTVDQEVKLTLECSRSRSRSMVVIFVLALYTGARFGVVRRLQWGNIDFKKHCLQWGKDKTASGDHRIIPLARRAYDALALWADNFPHRQPQDYVFPSERAGGGGHKFGKGEQGVAYDTDVTKPIGSVKTAWEQAQSRSGVRCRIHDLRHTATTRMLEAGIPIHQIGEIQGWSASQLILMVRLYSHFNTERHRIAVESIDLIAHQAQALEESRQKSRQSAAAHSADSPKLLM